MGNGIRDEEVDNGLAEITEKGQQGIYEDLVSEVKKAMLGKLALRLNYKEVVLENSMN